MYFDAGIRQLSEEPLLPLQCLAITLSILAGLFLPFVRLDLAGFVFRVSTGNGAHNRAKQHFKHLYAVDHYALICKSDLIPRHLHKVFKRMAS